MTASTITFEQRLQHARENGKQAMQLLAEDHLPLVYAMAKRFPWHVREREELYQQGCIGLMKALARFDPEYGARPLRRAIQSKIEDKLSEEILEGRINPGDTCVCKANGKEFIFEKV